MLTISANKLKPVDGRTIILCEVNIENANNLCP
jgi:hypothetical protein